MTIRHLLIQRNKIETDLLPTQNSATNNKLH